MNEHPSLYFAAFLLTLRDYEKVNYYSSPPSFWWWSTAVQYYIWGALLDSAESTRCIFVLPPPFLFVVFIARRVVKNCERRFFETWVAARLCNFCLELSFAQTRTGVISLIREREREGGFLMATFALQRWEEDECSDIIAEKEEWRRRLLQKLLANCCKSNLFYGGIFWPRLTTDVEIESECD